MKIAFLGLSLFLLAFSTASAFVVDTDGELLRNGGSYYIVPAYRGKGGGLGLDNTGNETCPLSVVQDPNELSDGSAVRISSPFRIAYIHEGLPLELAFVAVPTCANTPSRWTVVKGLPIGWSVKLTGYENTLDGWFRIERYQSDYKLVFCPESSVTCGDIGIHTDDDGVRHVVVGHVNGPFVVQFKKASESVKRSDH